MIKAGIMKHWREKFGVKEMLDVVTLGKIGKEKAEGQCIMRECGITELEKAFRVI